MPNRMLKKITPKTISEAVSQPYDLLELPRPNGYVEDRHLYDLFGVVNRIRQGATDKGAWVQFKGRFRAVTPEGEVFESGSTHIPGGMYEDLLFAAYDEAKAKTGGQAVSIEFAVRVSIKRAPKGKPSATGYEYDVQPLVQRQVSADDPIERLMSEASKAPALPGPGTESASKTGAPEPGAASAPETDRPAMGAAARKRA